METACRFAHGTVAGLLSQGQMAGLCTETYSPSRLTFLHLQNIKKSAVITKVKT